MVKAEIVVKVNTDEIAGKSRAIVRRTVRDDKGKITAKYALTEHGNWMIIPEGSRYPDICILDAILEEEGEPHGRTYPA